LPSSNHRPRIAAVVVIDIVSLGSSGSIIAITVAVALAVSTIAIIAVIVDVASSMLFRHLHQNGGGKFPWYLSYKFLCWKFGKAACGLWKRVFLVITIEAT
jgi:hypothetical protein